MAKECETKYRIMEVALELIWRSSYDAVGVGEICKKAKVNKGSFYHFFPSKEALAVAALEEYWQRIQPVFDTLFSPQKGPLERIAAYCDHMLKAQKEKRAKLGFVCGCPYTSVGIEQCSQSRSIGRTIEKLMDKSKKYFTVAVKDAADEGLIKAADPAKRADEIYTYYLGAMTQARIYNDLRFIEGTKEDIMAMLGAKNAPMTAGV